MAATIEWKGVGARGVLRADLERERDELADAGRRYDWPAMLAIVRRSPGLANSVRPGGESLFAPLHQVAHGGGPSSVASTLCSLGAWRTLRNAEGERPLDIARARGHEHLWSVLTPTHLRHVPADTLAAIQTNFHAVIRGRASDLIERGALRLPQLAPMLEVLEGRWWFAVPGMYGGFAYWLEGDGHGSRLISESWSRVVGGSGERHEIDAEGSRLVESGFV